jgi:hypothetical protein
MYHSGAPELVAQAAGFVLAHAPTMLACLVGIVLAVVRWRRHPRVSALLLGGFGLLLVLAPTATLVNAALLPHLASRFGADTLRTLLPLLGMAGSVFAAAAYALLLWAALANRAPRAS